MKIMTEKSGETGTYYDQMGQPMWDRYWFVTPNSRIASSPKHAPYWRVFQLNRRRRFQPSVLAKRQGQITRSMLMDRKKTTKNIHNSADNFRFPAPHATVQRVGYGAMQLAGPGVFGPPKDRAAALAVLREAVAAASTTSTPAISTARTSPTRYPRGAASLSRMISSSSPRSAPGVARMPHGSRPFRREELTQAVHDNLRNLGLDVLDMVNLRMHGRRPWAGRRSIEAPLDGAGRTAAAGSDPSHRPQQRHARADRGRRAIADRLRAEHLQCRPPGR